MIGKVLQNDAFMACTPIGSGSDFARIAMFRRPWRPLSLALPPLQASDSGIVA
jgi:hypothetical protein